MLELGALAGSMHNRAMNDKHLTRRQFLNSTTAAVAAAAVCGPALLPRTARAASSKKVIGIQVGAVSFADEGTERVLDILQQRGAVNTVFLATFTYGRGIGGRQVPNHP